MSSKKTLTEQGTLALRFQLLGRSTLEFFGCFLALAHQGDYVRSVLHPSPLEGLVVFRCR